MNKLLLIIIFCLFINVQNSKAQFLYGIVPDTGSQGNSFPITITGSETFWGASTYVLAIFDSIGVFANNVVIINDTILHANVLITGVASLGWHKVTTADQFLNFISKDSAFFVKLSAPSAPSLTFPPNNGQLINTNPLFRWDTNGYATTFRIQVAADSLFNNVVKDTTKLNIQGYQLPDILQLNTFYWWRAMFFNALGQSPWSVVFKFKTRITGINLIGNNIPEQYKLYENYPNPFNPITKIKFDITKSEFRSQYSEVRLIIYDILGKEVAELVNEQLEPGVYEVTFNGSNLSSGIYFYRLTVNNFSETKRMALIK
jgi:hypothetical protein